MRSNMAENIGWNILKSDKIWCQWVSERHSVVSDSLPPHGLNSPWNSPGQNTGVDSSFPLQGIFPTEGLKPGLSHCRRILYQLSHQRSPKTLEWVAYPFSSGSSRPRDRTRVSCIVDRCFTVWANSVLKIKTSTAAAVAAAAAKSHQSCPTLCDPIDGGPPGSHPWDSPGKNTGVGCHFFLQRMKVKSESEVA